MRSLQAKIVFMIAACMAVALAAVLAVEYLSIGDIVDRDLNLTVKGEAQSLAIDVAAEAGVDSAGPDLVRIVDGLASSSAYSDAGSAALIDANGNLLYLEERGVRSEDAPSADVDALWAAARKSLETGEATGGSWTGEPYRIYAEEVGDGVALVAMEPESQARQAVWASLAAGACVALVCLAVACAIVYALSRRMTRPLRALLRETEEMADGDYVVDIAADSNDEIGELARTFGEMADQVGERIMVDPLSERVGSKMACEMAAERLDREIEQGTADFTVVMADVNDLKVVNDTFGHVAGSQLLCDAAELMADVFGEGCVYHWGGDEFAAIVPGSTLDGRQKWWDAFEQAVAKFNDDLRDENGEYARPYHSELSIAWGIVAFDPAKFSSYKEVFEAADKEMYKHKEKLKKGRR